MSQEDLTSSNLGGPGTPVDDTAPHKPSGDEEIVYYEGRPLLRADQAKAIMYGLIGVALIGWPIVAWVMDKHPPMIVALISIVLGILAFIAPMIIMRTTRYKITSYRIDFERGILKKRIDTLELWHVEDLRFEQGLLDRIMNVGSIIITSHDDTTPKLEMHGIPDPRPLFEKLKQR
ncbi:MAG TPA: PH domain-containing protein, partial [Tepidisphaeraceae bacterium]|nr:PH domain-containing protein [Tepidisphaeraceae bacterium]